MSEEVEINFWKKQAKCSDLFKFKFTEPILKNGSQEVRNECSGNRFFHFFANLRVTKLSLFSGKARQYFGNLLYEVFKKPKMVFRFFYLFRQSLLVFLNISNVLNVSM